jgi:glycosyltransferase involved in cell wall biosynthesis
VFETDDDLTDRYRDFGRGHEIEATMTWADAATVSTRPLGDVMEQFGKPVYVLPNLLDVAWYKNTAIEAPREVKGLTIGLCGTRTHFFDWALVLEALKEIKQKYPHVQIVTCGYPAPFMKQVPDVLHINGVPFAYYPAVLAQLDIRLLPLDTEDKFNLSKSGIGAMEAMAAARFIKGKRKGGCIPIATKCPAYEGVIEDGRSGYLVEHNTTGEWIAAIEPLLVDAGRRKRMAAAVLEAADRFDIRHGVAQRYQAYQAIAH